MTSPFTPSWKQNKTKQNKTKPNLTTKITTESKVLRQMSGTCLKIESLMACHSI